MGQAHLSNGLADTPSAWAEEPSAWMRAFARWGRDRRVGYPAPVQMASEQVAIVGDGQMALVLSDVLSVRGIATTILSPFERAAAALSRERISPRLPSFRLPDSVVVTADATALRHATLVVCAIPTQFIRPTFARIAPSIGAGVPIVSIAKGIEVESFELPCDILRAATGERPICALSGPTVAAELARRLPAVLVAASADPAEAKDLANELANLVNNRTRDDQRIRSQEAAESYERRVNHLSELLTATGQQVAIEATDRLNNPGKYHGFPPGISINQMRLEVLKSLVTEEIRQKTLSSLVPTSAPEMRIELIDSAFVPVRKMQWTAP